MTNTTTTAAILTDELGRSWSWTRKVGAKVAHLKTEWRTACGILTAPGKDEWVADEAAGRCKSCEKIEAKLAALEINQVVEAVEAVEVATEAAATEPVVALVKDTRYNGDTEYKVLVDGAQVGVVYKPTNRQTNGLATASWPWITRSSRSSVATVSRTKADAVRKLTAPRHQVPRTAPVAQAEPEDRGAYLRPEETIDPAHKAAVIIVEAAQQLAEDISKGDNAAGYAAYDKAVYGDRDIAISGLCESCGDDVSELVYDDPTASYLCSTCATAEAPAPVIDQTVYQASAIIEKDGRRYSWANKSFSGRGVRTNHLMTWGRKTLCGMSSGHGLWVGSMHDNDGMLIGRSCATCEAMGRKIAKPYVEPVATLELTKTELDTLRSLVGRGRDSYQGDAEMYATLAARLEREGSDVGYTRKNAEYTAKMAAEADSIASKLSFAAGVFVE